MTCGSLGESLVGQATLPQHIQSAESEQPLIESTRRRLVATAVPITGVPNKHFIDLLFEETGELTNEEATQVATDSLEQVFHQLDSSSAQS